MPPLRTSTLPTSTLRKSAGRTNRQGLLAGKQILIVEDSFLLGLDLSRFVESLGCVRRGPFSSTREALACLRQQDIDGAIIDFDLQETSAAVAAELVAQGIPFVVVSSYEHDFLPAHLRKEDYIGKPISRTSLAEIACARFG